MLSPLKKLDMVKRMIIISNLEEEEVMYISTTSPSIEVLLDAPPMTMTMKKEVEIP